MLFESNRAEDAKKRKEHREKAANSQLSCQLIIRAARAHVGLVKEFNKPFTINV